MSKLKISENQFIGKQELNRFKKFLDDDGFRKLFLKQSSSFGIFQTDSDNFPNFLVTQGSNVGTVKHNEGYAINNLGNIIYRPATDNISIPSDNIWRKIKISHSFSPIESGTVSIDANGTLTGTGTEFLSLLRGTKSLWQSVIKFKNAINNTGEYHVASVIDDTNAILQGNFIAESDLTYSVIGSFNPASPPLAGDKEIFQYDSCTFEIVADSATLSTGTEFFIARVKNDGGNITIQDLRDRYLYQSSFQYKQEKISLTANPLIGVESIKFNNPKNTKERNIVRVGWGFRSNNWSYNPSLNRITLNAGEGGKYTTVSDFQDGDFNLWRLYTQDGKYKIIKTSFKQGAQINLDLNSSDYTSFESVETITIVPDADSIILHFNPDPSQNYPNAAQNYQFAIENSFADCQVLCFENESKYAVEYKYKKGSKYSSKRSIPSNSLGYYTEESFDTSGEIKAELDRVRSPYNDLITLQLASNSYANIIDQFFLGDIEGINRTELDNSNPIQSIQVGVDRQTQIFEGDITLTTDHFIDLSLDDAQNGNKFYLRFDGDIVLNSNLLQVTQNFSNPGDPGDILFSFDSNSLTRVRNNNLVLECFFDGTTWQVFQISSFNEIYPLSVTTDSIVNNAIESYHLNTSAQNLFLSSSFTWSPVSAPTGNGPDATVSVANAFYRVDRSGTVHFKGYVDVTLSGTGSPFLNIARVIQVTRIAGVSMALESDIGVGLSSAKSGIFTSSNLLVSRAAGRYYLDGIVIPA